MSEEPILGIRELQGFATLAETCASALLAEPDETVVEALRRVAHVFGDTRFDRTSASAELTQRYYDRFFVPAGSLYIPLCESSVRDSRMENGRMCWVSPGGATADHVLGCYRAVGFDYRCSEGFDLAVKNLKVDSMAAELSFMASLAWAAVEGDEAARPRTVGLLRQFVNEHPSQWFGKAVDYLAAEEDFYHGVCVFATDALMVFGE